MAAGVTEQVHITWAQNTQGRKVKTPILGSEAQDGGIAHVDSGGLLQGASKHQGHLFDCRGLQGERGKEGGGWRVV